VGSSLQNGASGFVEGTTSTWGATDPFPGGTEFAGIWNGVATYDYSSPRSALTILWGSPSSDNVIEFFGPTDDLLGTINGGDLLSSWATDPYVETVESASI
jgi:hypothetical protein